MQLNPRSFNPVNLFIASASGLILTLAFPKSDLSLFAWFAFVPFLHTLRSASKKESLLLGFVFGFTHYTTLLYWVVYTLNTYGYLPLFLCIPILFLLTFYLSLYTSLFSWIVTSWIKKPTLLIIAAPSLWVCLEYIRSFALSGFPWELIGYSQHNVIPLIQIADTTGVYGISFLIILTNTAIYLIWLTLSRNTWQTSPISPAAGILSGTVAISLLIATLIYGNHRIKTITALCTQSPQKTIAVLQGNIDQSIKWDTSYQVDTLKKYHTLSLTAAENSPDLIVWPETAAPFYYQHNTPLTRYLNLNIKQTKSPHLIGSPSFIKTDHGFKFYNSAYLIMSDTSVAGKYDKVHLVPFGEYVPLKQFLPFVNKLTEQSGDFYSGDAGNVLALNDLNTGVQICFEMIFPELSREMVKNGATLIVNMTNDAWFGKQSAPYQHFSMIKFRAVENRRSVARAANTGISGFVDPTGRVMAATDLFQDASLTQSLPMLTTQTPYTTYGDFFAVGCFPLLLAVVAISRRLTPKEASSHPQEELAHSMAK